METQRLWFATLVLLLVLSGHAHAGEQQGHYFTTDGGVAIGGYDLVAYFTTNTAVKGSKQYQVEYEGAEWRFASAENQTAFEKDPEDYLPKYGGWCAYAMGEKNMKFGVDPRSFKLYNGELYLFYNGEHGNASVPWNADEMVMKKKADANWEKMKESDG